jgi:hypothetical protein
MGSSPPAFSVSRGRKFQPATAARSDPAERDLKFRS